MKKRLKKKIYSYKEVTEILRDRCSLAGGAKAWGMQQRPKISFGYVSAVLRGDAKLGKKILDAMKMEEIYVLINKADKKEVIMKFEDI